jgi:hypothetical protein
MMIIEVGIGIGLFVVLILILKIIKNNLEDED